MAEGSLRTGTKLAYAIGAVAESGIGMAFNAFNFLFYKALKDGGVYFIGETDL